VGLEYTLGVAVQASTGVKCGTLSSLREIGNTCTYSPIFLGDYP